jgi:hypothetical protein
MDRDGKVVDQSSYKPRSIRAQKENEPDDKKKK